MIYPLKVFNIQCTYYDNKAYIYSEQLVLTLTLPSPSTGVSGSLTVTVA